VARAEERKDVEQGGRKRTMKEQQKATLPNPITVKEDVY